MVELTSWWHVSMKLKFLCQIIKCQNYKVYYRVYKKTEQIWNRSQRREAAQSMKFLINIDCLGTYDVE